MIVTWVTQDPVNESMVEFGLTSLNQVAQGSSQVFVDGGTQKRSMTVHRVQLTNLVPGQTYRECLTSRLYYGYLSLYAISRLSLWLQDLWLVSGILLYCHEIRPRLVAPFCCFR